MARGNLLYVTDYADDGTVSVVTPDGKVKVLVPRGSGLKRPVGIVINPVRNTLLVGSSVDGTVWEIDPVDGTVRIDDVVAIEFEPELAFDQTPGPKAGQPITGAA